MKDLSVYENIYDLINSFFIISIFGGKSCELEKLALISQEAGDSECSPLFRFFFQFIMYICFEHFLYW